MIDQFNQRDGYTSSFYKKSESRPTILSHNLESKLKMANHPFATGVKTSKSVQKFGLRSQNQKVFDHLTESQYERLSHQERSSNGEAMQRKIM